MSGVRAPLPEIREADAAGPIAVLYGDIRSTIGVTMVNLVFRNMATVPGCLDWAWSHLKPIYATGLVETAAGRILEVSGVDGVVSFAASDIAATGAPADAVAAVGQAYARANPMNLLGLDVLKRLLDDADAKRPTRAEKPEFGEFGVSEFGVRVKTTDFALTPNSNSPKSGPLPSMIDLAKITPAVSSQLDHLARQLHQGDNGVIPSLYRHLAHWPALLDLIDARLAPAIASGELFAVADRLRASAITAADELYRHCPRLDLTAPTGAIAANLRALIATFPDNICRMTIVARALAHLAP